MKSWICLSLLFLAGSLAAQPLEFSIAQGVTLRTELRDYPEAARHSLFPAYQKFFGLSTLPVRAGGVTLPAGGKIFVQTYRGQGSGRWILLVHGYLESSALNARAIGFFLQQGFSVAALDLPGHGLSTGEHGVISDFDQYGDALQRVVTLVESEESVNAWIPVGFSAGGASVVNWLERYRPPHADQIVLVAPLVRSWLWDLSQFGMTLIGWALDRVPNRSARDSTSNPEFATMLADLDPFRASTTSLTWVRALANWARRVEDLAANPRPRVLLLQGGDDTVVDGPYNRNALTRLFPRLVWEGFPTLRHTLLNEPGREGDRVYATIAQFLGPPTSSPGLR